MAEILTLQYNAGTEGLLVTLDAVGTHGGPMAGAALPTERVTLADMEPALADRWRSLLSDTHDYLRARVPAHGVIPEELVAERAALSKEREAIAQERLAHEADMAAKQELLANAEAQIAMRNVELAAIAAEAPAVAAVVAS